MAAGGVREVEEKCRALGSGWRAMTEVDSPRFAVGLSPATARRFASCDLYPVYSSCPSRPPPGISRDICGYLTRENNLRGYIVVGRTESRESEASVWGAEDRPRVDRRGDLLLHVAAHGRAVFASRLVKIASGSAEKHSHSAPRSSRGKTRAATANCRQSKMEC